jgi:hypothetical protein
VERYLKEAVGLVQGLDGSREEIQTAKNQQTKPKKKTC